ncbi:MAG: hypothetical protein K8S18_05810 [Desulfobacula sp.]|nr:hypothetical protein [Desulfobacula sp.]
MIEMIKDKPYISTVFPGIYAPPFPDKNIQFEIEYNENVKFWDEYVLIDPKL